MTKREKLGVIAGPPGVAMAIPTDRKMPHHVAVGIKNADFWNGYGGQTFLESRFAQQVLGPEG